MRDETVSIGLRSKTARAIAVVLGGPLDKPRVMKRLELSLADPRVPATVQPYHEVMDLPWDRAKVDVRKTAAKIEAVASQALAHLVREMQKEGLLVCGVGVVGAGERNLEKIGSTHIRAHAAEGVLFRQVLEFAAAASGLPCRTFDERTLDETAARELERPLARLKAQLADLGKSAGPPWRADEKAAATAAWLAFAASGR